MTLNHILKAMKDTLETDEYFIEDLNRQLQQNKAKGENCNKLHKDLVSAQEKHVKHLKDYYKFINDHQIKIDQKDDSEISDSKDQIEATQPEVEPDPETTHNKNINTKNSSSNNDQDDFTSRMKFHKQRIRDMEKHIQYLKKLKKQKIP